MGWKRCRRLCCSREKMSMKTRCRWLVGLFVAAIFGHGPVASAAMPEHGPKSITEFFLVCWVPELREYDPPRGSAEEILLKIAQLVHCGRIADAERQLVEFRKIAERNHDWTRQALCSL